MILTMRRGDLTNEQWAKLEPLLPKGKQPGRPAKHAKRQLIDGIRWRVRTVRSGGTYQPAIAHGRPYMDCSGGGSAMARGRRS
jgi:hypothetical protein